MELQPFNLSNKSGARAIDSTGQRLTIPGGIGDQIRILNLGPNIVCVMAGSGSQTAVMPTDNATPNGSGLVIAVGSTEVFSIGSSVDIHAICAAAATATIYVSRGSGA